MPTPRFLALPPDKRDRITAAAVAEFAEQGLEGAAVAGVVRRAGIPRGSFYQYFEDMYDLFGHVFDAMQSAKLGFLADTLAQADRLPFIDFFHLMCRDGLRFAEAHPQFVVLGSRMQTTADPGFARYVALAKGRAVEFFVPLIERDKAAGLISRLIDSGLLAVLLVAILSEVTAKDLYSRSKTTAELMGAADGLVHILRHGITTDKEGSRCSR